MNVDANERSRNTPVRLQSKTRYDRILCFFEVNLPSSFPLSADQSPRTLLLALVAHVKPTKLDPQLGTLICHGCHGRTR